MKVTNSTKYLTKDLKRIFIECCKLKLDSWKNLKVEVTYNKSRWITGLAQFGGGLHDSGGKIQIFLPRNFVDKEFIDTRYRFTEPKPYAYLNFKQCLAWVFLHELFHTLNKRHHKMTGGYYAHYRDYASNPEKMSWVNNFPLRQREVQIKPKMNLQVKRYEHVLAALKDKKSKLKRLQNQIRKWTQKKLYYEHALTANKKIKKEDLE